MHFDIFDPITLRRVGYVPTWHSARWEDTYNTMGEFTLEVLDTDDNRALLQLGCWVRKSDADSLMRICSRSNANQGGYLVVSGFSAAWILSKRASTAIVKGENAEAAMRRLVQQMQPWPNLYLGPAVGFDTIFDSQISGDTVFNYCATIGAACDLGFKIVLAQDSGGAYLRFDVYRPAQDKNRVYSRAFGNLIAPTWTFADNASANVAIVQGAGEGASRATVTVGLTDSTGADRREIYVDARDLQPDEGETNASPAYLARLAARGAKKLLDALPIGDVDFSIDDDSLQPGDVVRVILPDLGYTATARIASVITQSQEGGETRSVRVSAPVWEAL